MRSLISRFSDEDQFFAVEYSIYSQFGDIEAGRYILEIHGTLSRTTYKNGDATGESTIAGKLSLYKVLMKNAINDSYSLLEICDHTSEIAFYMQELWDIENVDFDQRIIDIWDDLIDRDILILRSVEILPEFRGFGLGRCVVKDAYNNFSSGCALFVSDCDPLQFHEPQDDFQRDMKYETFTQDEELAHFKVMAFLKSVGFELFPHFSDRIVLLNSENRNPVLHSIKLQ